MPILTSDKISTYLYKLLFIYIFLEFDANRDSGGKTSRRSTRSLLPVCDKILTQIPV